MRISTLTAGADRIVATNSCGLYPSFSLTISGDEARRIVRDVSSMHPVPLPSNCIFCWELRFYRDGQDLASIHVCHDMFIFGNDEYYGDTGVLGALSDKLDKLTEH
jgi:hypothetical protein